MTNKKKKAIVVATIMSMTTTLSLMVPVKAQETDTKIAASIMKQAVPELVLPQTSKVDESKIDSRAVVEVSIDATNFPDEAFRNYIRAFDLDGDGILSQVEIDNVVRIDVATINTIKSLKGIEIFTKLQSLVCHNTGLESLDVSANTALTYLDCSKTKIVNLDVKANTALETLICFSNPNLTNIDVSQCTALQKLWCYYTEIEKLDVSANTALKSLQCNDNLKLESLDISTNINLEELYCSNTTINKLGLSSNTALKTLRCSNTKITELNINNNTILNTLWCQDNTKLTKLDVSANTELRILYCAGTELVSLDVTNNHQLKELDVLKTNLTYLNIGTNNGLALTKSTKSTSKLNITEDTFNITEKMPGIDPSKITITSGATLDKTTGIMSDYGIDTPIIYRYDCGTSKAGPQSLTVELTLEATKSDSSITINKNLNKSYDGKEVELSDTDLIVTGSKRNITYAWQKQVDGNWITLSKAPTDVGMYRVNLKVAESDFYKAVEHTLEFTIGKAETTIKVNKDLNKIYDAKTVELSGHDFIVTGSTGTIAYTWEIADGTSWISSDTPVNVGIYRVMVTVEADEHYQAATSTVEFTIGAMMDDQPNVPVDKENSINIENTSSNQTISQETVVKTGDTQPIGLMTMLSALSLGIMTIVIAKKRKRLN